MVWPFTSSDSSKGGKDSTADAYAKLDPTLRKFLERETPAQYEPSKAPEREPTSREKVNLVPRPDQPNPTNPTTHSSSPPPTLYPDGRYAHLWKTYRPRSEIEAEGKTDQEKLNDVLQSWQDRRNSISRAALENCAAINEELDECFRKPNLRQRTTMCRTETRKLNRCLDMNKRFLSALGYLSVADRTEQEEEAVQMHADRLYVRMLRQEKEVLEAKAEGREIPMPSVFDGQNVARPSILDQLTEVGKQRLEERTKDLSPVEKEIEVRAFAAEMQAGKETLENLERHRVEVRQARLERIESGKARTFDKLQAWFGW